MFLEMTCLFKHLQPALLMVNYLMQNLIGNDAKPHKVHVLPATSMYKKGQFYAQVCINHEVML